MFRPFLSGPRVDARITLCNARLSLNFLVVRLVGLNPEVTFMAARTNIRSVIRRFEMPTDTDPPPDILI